MASRYWVGGGSSTNWNATGNTNWSATDGGANNASVPAIGDDVYFKSAANCAFNASVSLRSFDMTGYTGTLSGVSTLTVTGAASSTVACILAGTGFTYTGTINLNPVASTTTINFTTNGKPITALQIAASFGAVVFQDNVACAASAGVRSILVNGAVTVNMNGKLFSGASASSRLLIASFYQGAQRTLTTNVCTFAYCDFADIALDTPMDLSAITGGSGDCGNNSNITFTAGITQYITGPNNITWSTYGWATRVPLPQDTVLGSGASQFTSGRVITMDMLRVPGIDFTGVTWTGTGPAFNPGTNFQIFGSLTLPTGMLTSASTYGPAFAGRASTMVLTTNGAIWQQPIFVNALGGTLQLGSALSMIAARTLTVTAGTFDANDFSVQVGLFAPANFSTAIVYMGNATWTIIGTGTVWNIGAAAVIYCEGSTVEITDTSATGKTFVGVSKTYNVVRFSGDNITISSSATITTLRVDNSPATNGGLKVATAATLTITGGITTNATGGESLSKICSATPGTRFTITGSSPLAVSVDHMTIVDCAATGTATWNGGTDPAANSTTNNNTGWSWTSGGTVHALSGLTAGLGSTTGALSKRAALSGVASGVSSASGALSKRAALSGSSAGTSSASGFLRKLSKLSGTTSGIGSATGALRKLSALSGATSGVGSARGYFQTGGGTVHALSGLSAGSSSATGALSKRSGLSGSSAGTSSIRGQLTKRAALSGRSSGTSFITGNLTLLYASTTDHFSKVFRMVDIDGRPRGYVVVDGTARLCLAINGKKRDI